jgi:hypothetical protein
VIWVKSEPEYFCEKHWTTQIRLNCFNKSRCARNRPGVRNRRIVDR